MSAHHATIDWRLGDGDFLGRKYSREHRLSFSGGLSVPGSPAPAVVPAPWSRVDALDPESAFTGALAACHMLWFLDLASRAGFAVRAYHDTAEGTLARIGKGKMAMTRVVLRPRVEFAGETGPTAAQIAALHHAAHEACFIANSVTTEVVIES